MRTNGELVNGLWVQEDVKIDPECVWWAVAYLNCRNLGKVNTEPCSSASPEHSSQWETPYALDLHQALLQFLPKLLLQDTL